MANKLKTLIEQNGVLLADGATGTTLFAMGLPAGGAPELWNDEKPENIEAMHQGFVDAGSDIILTNSFGGTRHRLKLHEADHRVEELNEKAAKIARKIADNATREVIVAGSVGPTGELLHPLGDLTYDQCVDSFKEQIKGLKAGGADVIWIETMSSPEEINAAAQAAIANEMPYVVTASFDTAGRTMMGLLPKNLGSSISQEQEPVAYGANCGVGASDLLSSVLDMTEAAPNAIIVAKANCGIPVIKGDEVEYSGTPKLMHDYTTMAINAGAKIVGGCCGTTCDHLKEMRVAIDQHSPGMRPTATDIESQIGPFVNKQATENTDTDGGRTRKRRRAR